MAGSNQGSPSDRETAQVSADLDEARAAYNKAVRDYDIAEAEGRSDGELLRLFERMASAKWTVGDLEADARP